jgi:hypothetical protein
LPAGTSFFTAAFSWPERQLEMSSPPNEPLSNPGNDSQTGELTIGKAIRWVAQFIGVVGGGGAGFTALAFGIGYMVTKSHDAMLGLPTMMTSSEFYVRLGALFFPNSLHHMAGGVTHPFSAGIFFIVLGIILLSAVFALWTPTKRPGLICTGLIVGYMVIITLAIFATAHQSAVLSSANQDLLFKEARDAKGARAYALKIHDLLRDDNEKSSDIALKRLYGRQLFMTLALIYTVFLFWKWRTRIQALLEKSVLSSVISWVMLPALLILILVQLILIPVNYGVLCVTRTPPCVEIMLKDGGRPENKSYLLSDLSTDDPKVVTMYVTGAGLIFHKIHDRDDIAQIRVTRCRNPLAAR